MPIFNPIPLAHAPSPTAPESLSGSFSEQKLKPGYAGTRKASGEGRETGKQIPNYH